MRQGVQVGERGRGCQKGGGKGHTAGREQDEGSETGKCMDALGKGDRKG